MIGLYFGPCSPRSSILLDRLPSNGRRFGPVRSRQEMARVSLILPVAPGVDASEDRIVPFRRVLEEAGHQVEIEVVVVDPRADARFRGSWRVGSHAHCRPSRHGRRDAPWPARGDRRLAGRDRSGPGIHAQGPDLRGRTRGARRGRARGGEPARRARILGRTIGLVRDDGARLPGKLRPIVGTRWS